MSADDRPLIAFLELARLSQDRGQLIPRDKFLTLAGHSACRSGCSDVAEICRALILNHNPSHGLKNYISFQHACQSETFLLQLVALDRFCTFERAEHLMAENDLKLADSFGDVEAVALEILESMPPTGP